MSLNSLVRSTLLLLSTATLLSLPGIAQMSDHNPWHGEKTEAYEVYAKSAEEVVRAKPDLDFAVRKFQQYFGEAPPLIAVVLFDSPAEIQKYDFSELIHRRVVYLAWVTGTGFEKSVNAQLQLTAMPELGVFLMNNSGTPGASVVQTLPIGMVRELAKGDVIIALNHQPCASASEVQRLYGVVPVGEKVELDLLRGGQAASVTFSKPANMNAKVSTTSSSAGLTRVLSHEAGHMYLRAWLRKRAEAVAVAKNVPPTDPAIPEWFDESVATLFENPDLQKQRTESLLQQFDHLIPLDELLVMANPMKPTQDDLEKQSTGGHPQDGMVLKTYVGPMAERGSLFYAETLNFGQFVTSKFGPTAIRELAVGLTEGMTTEQVLGRLNHSPITISELETMWRVSIRR